MGLLEDLGDKLAAETLELIDSTGDETLVEQIAKVVGSSSTTMEETFLTAVRIRRAAKRGHQALEQIKMGKAIDTRLLQATAPDPVSDL